MTRAQSRDGTVKAVEAKLAGPFFLGTLRTSMASNMPLTGHVILIIDKSQSLGDSQNISTRLNLIPVQFLITRHQTDSSLMLVEPRQQRRTGRATTGSVVKMGKTLAALARELRLGVWISPP